MGQLQHISNPGSPARGRRLGWRVCLRKGCGRRFQARRYNQRYCQAPECRQQVRRWQGAKRQRKCRADPAGRQRHAEAERQRRKEKAAQTDRPDACEACAADAASDASAWSRSKKLPESFCDRPGCYEPPRDSPRVTASYCSDGCRTAVQQTCDRERKWLRRKREAGRFKRRLEYQTVRAHRREEHAGPGGSPARRYSAQPDPSRRAVPDYGGEGGSRPDCEGSMEVKSHASQESADSRPRAPPAEGRLVVD